MKNTHFFLIGILLPALFIITPVTPSRGDTHDSPSPEMFYWTDNSNNYLALTIHDARQAAPIVLGRVRSGKPYYRYSFRHNNRHGRHYRNHSYTYQYRHRFPYGKHYGHGYGYGGHNKFRYGNNHGHQGHHKPHFGSRHDFRYRYRGYGSYR